MENVDLERKHVDLTQTSGKVEDYEFNWNTRDDAINGKLVLKKEFISKMKKKSEDNNWRPPKQELSAFSGC